jgi:hypothetical protein
LLDTLILTNAMTCPVQERPLKRKARPPVLRSQIRQTASIADVDVASLGRKFQKLKLLLPHESIYTLLIFFSTPTTTPLQNPKLGYIIRSEDGYPIASHIRQGKSTRTPEQENRKTKHRRGQ